VSEEEKKELWHRLTKEYLTTEQKLELIKEINIQKYDQEFKHWLDSIDPDLHPDIPELLDILKKINNFR